MAYSLWCMGVYMYIHVAKYIEYSKMQFGVPTQYEQSIAWDPYIPTYCNLDTLVNKSIPWDRYIPTYCNLQTSVNKSIPWDPYIPTYCNLQTS